MIVLDQKRPAFFFLAKGHTRYCGLVSEQHVWKSQHVDELIG